MCSSTVDRWSWSARVHSNCKLGVARIFWVRPLIRFIFIKLQITGWTQPEGG